MKRFAAWVLAFAAFVVFGFAAFGAWDAARQANLLVAFGMAALAVSSAVLGRGIIRALRSPEP